MKVPWFTQLTQQFTMSDTTNSPATSPEIRPYTGPIRRPILSFRVDTLAQDLEDQRDIIRGLQYEIRVLRDQLKVAKSEIATMKLFMPEARCEPSQKRQRIEDDVSVIELESDEELNLSDLEDLPIMFD